jgi:tRNA (mo5U34)-methyltransferase
MTLESSGAGLRDGDAIDRQIAALGPWFHNLHLPSGHRTAPDHPLGDFPAFKWKQIADAIPADLSGATALDIGCNAGFYSFALASRGARVTGLDVDERYLRQARWAASQLDPEGRVRFVHGQVYDLAAITERFDLVLFLGVLYHLRYPLLALDLVATRVRGQLVLQTLTMPGAPEREAPADLHIDDRDELTAPGWPRCAFVEHALAGDPTNWWAPDDACVRAMLRSAGLRVVCAPAHEFYVCEPDAEASPTARRLREEEMAAALRLTTGATRPAAAPATGSTRRNGSSRSG